MKRWLAVAVFSSAAVGCVDSFGWAKPPADETASSETPSSDVPAPVGVSVQASIATEPTGAVLLADVQSVDAMLSMRNAGEGEVRAEFEAPNGDAFQASIQSLSGTNVDELLFELPVAGTVVQSGGLSGVWKIHFSLNGAELSTQTFELSP